MSVFVVVLPKTQVRVVVAEHGARHAAATVVRVADEPRLALLAPRALEQVNSKLT